jgi:glycosyltransferase involved in cell wall biosynthesis
VRVALLAPISWRVPPRHYGPWERVVALLTEGLVAAGVDVTLFATADSSTSAPLAAVVPRPYSEDPDLDAKVWECIHIAEVFERAREFDVIHNHFDFLPLSYSRLVPTPVVTTIHGFSSARILPVYERYDDTATYVAISDADRSPRLTYAATVHHGIDLAEFTFVPEAGDHLVFLGRISPEKGTAEAIEVARRAGRPLVIAGIVQDQAYFDAEVAPHLDGTGVRYVGSVGPAERDALLGSSAALLHLVNFAEPFGLSMVESLACGTPVIARPLGSVPEVVRHGETGFHVDSVAAAVAAVARLPELERAAARRDAERRFTVEHMTAGYLDVYAKLLADRG